MAGADLQDYMDHYSELMGLAPVSVGVSHHSFMDCRNVSPPLKASLLCFQRALKHTPMLGKEVCLQWSGVPLQCLWVQASLLICCWDFWFILWLYTVKMGDRNGPSVSQSSSFCWEINKISRCTKSCFASWIFPCLISWQPVLENLSKNLFIHL